MGQPLVRRGRQGTRVLAWHLHRGGGRCAQAQGAGLNRGSTGTWVKVFTQVGTAECACLWLCTRQEQLPTHRRHNGTLLSLPPAHVCEQTSTVATKRAGICNSHQAGGNLTSVSLGQLCYSQPLSAKVLLGNLLHREHPSAFEQKFSVIKIPLADLRRVKHHIVL